MREIERMIAGELANMVRPYMDSSGKTNFSFEVEIDPNMIAFVDGEMRYRIVYEEPVNYYHDTDVFVSINEISVYNSEGEEVKMNFNERAIETFMEQIIED